MSFKGYIGSATVLAAGGAASALGLGLVGAVESQYHAPGSLSALVYGFGLYGLVGLVCGVVAALLFGGKARGGRDGLERMSRKLGAWPVVLLVLAVGGFLVYRDVWKESIDAAGLTGWLTMVLVPVAAVGAGWLGGWLARALAVRPVGSAVVLAVLCLLGFLLGSAVERMPGSSVEVQQPAKAVAGPPVVVVVVDALRADATGVYAPGNQDTPNLDAFARDATVFADASACATWTRPSVSTILTGVYPSTHRTVHKTDRLPESLPTMAGLLRQQGYTTVASVTNVNLAPVFGLGRGFDAWGYFPPRPFLGAPSSGRRLFLVEIYRLLRLRFLAGDHQVVRYYAEGERVLERARTLMDTTIEAGAPLFAYLHFMEPHDPYFAHPYDGRAVARVENPDPPVDKAPAFRELYRQEVRHWDELFGQLVAYLEERGIYDRALLVVTSDHGEEFADHGGFWHGTSLYQELLHVPLVIRFPGGAGAGVRVDEPVSLVDLLPTVLAQAGIEARQELAGVALRPDAVVPGRVLFAEEDHQGCVLTAVRNGPWKLVRANADNPRGIAATELYNLAEDPREKNDLSAERPDERDRLLELLRAGPQAAVPAAEPRDVELDDATEEQLRSLGYTQ